MNTGLPTGRIARTLGELLVFLALILGGSLAATSASRRFGPPIDDLLAGLAVAAVAVGGVAWLRFVGAGGEERRTSSLAGLGGAVGFLAFEFLLDGTVPAPVGAALGAGLFAVGGLLWSRRSP